MCFMFIIMSILSVVPGALFSRLMDYHGQVNDLIKGLWMFWLLQVIYLQAIRIDKDHHNYCLCQGCIVFASVCMYVCLRGLFGTGTLPGQDSKVWHEILSIIGDCWGWMGSSFLRAFGVLPLPRPVVGWRYMFNWVPFCSCYNTKIQLFTFSELITPK